MDPLSVIASSLAISEALGLGIKTLRGLANTSSEFSEMLSELSSFQVWMNQLRLTVDKIGAAAGEGRQPHGLHLSDDVLSRLESARLDLGQIVDGMKDIQKQVIGEGDQKRLDRKGEQKVSMIQWQRSRGKVQKLREKAKRCREDLSACLELVGLSHQLQQHQTGIEILTTSHKQYSLLQSTFTRFDSRFDALESMLRTDILNSLATMVSEEPAIQKDHSDNKTRRSWMSASKSIDASSSATNIELSTRHTCARYCKCQCHRNTAIRTPAWSQALAGSLTLQFNAATRLEACPCDIRACRSGKNKLVKLTYRFPEWILRRAVVISASWGSLTNVGASLYLSVPRVNVPIYIFDALLSGDVHWLREMIASRRLLPTDISEEGELYFNYAILHGANRVQVAELLIKMGFNPSFSSPSTGQSVIMIAARILSYHQAKPTLSPEQRALCQQLVASRDLDERAGASNRIRDSVLGITSEPLEDALALEPDLVNELDDVGYSPLHWAAILGDLDKACLLLESGADINLLSDMSRTPLVVSVVEENASFASFMLSQNASVRTKDVDGRSVLHHCSDARLLKSLLDAGADPNDADYSAKLTPLHNLAVKRGLAAKGNGISQSIQHLIEAGADIEGKDYQNWTALLYGVSYNCVEVIQELCRLGARVDVIDNQGCGLLHLAAMYGNLDMINCLREMKIAEINPDLRHSEGWTPMDNFEYRMCQLQLPEQIRPTQQHVFAFYALISEIRRRNWERGLCLESREELEASGELENIQRWLGRQWQKLYDEAEFGDEKWVEDVDVWPDLYTEDDDVEYDMAILFGERLEARDFDVVQEELEDDGDEEFFDAME